MSLGFSAVARRFLVDEAATRAEYANPVLVWESPPGDRQAPFLLGTRGTQVTRPVSGEGLVFKIEKIPGKVNAFSMGVTVGRTENNDIVIEDNAVSRFHAYFRQNPSTRAWQLFDADSKHGTWVGPLRLSSGKPHELQSMARIKFGDVEMFYFVPDAFFEYLQGHIRP